MSSVIKGPRWSSNALQTRTLSSDFPFHGADASDAPAAPTEPTPEEIAAHMIADATERASRIVSEANLRAKNIEEEARRLGMESGTAEARALWQARMDALEEEAERLRNEFEALVAEAEPELARMSVEIARKVLKQEISQDQDAVLSVVRSAVHRVKDKQVRIRVNPADLETVRGARETFSSIADGVAEIDIVSDRRVGRAGCVVETPSGNLDARLETQLGLIEDVIEKATHEG